MSEKFDNNEKKSEPLTAVEDLEFFMPLKGCPHVLRLLADSWSGKLHKVLTAAGLRGGRHHCFLSTRQLNLK